MLSNQPSRGQFDPKPLNLLFRHWVIHMEGILLCPQKPCKSKGHKRCLKVRKLHQPISKAIEACDKWP